MSLEGSTRIKFSDTIMVLDGNDQKLKYQGTNCLGVVQEDPSIAAIEQTATPIIKRPTPSLSLEKKEIVLVEPVEAIFKALQTAQSHGTPSVVNYILRMEFDEAGETAAALEKFLQENNDSYVTFQDADVLNSVSLGFMILSRLANASGKMPDDNRVLEFLFQKQLFTHKAAEYYIRMAPKHYESTRQLWLSITGVDKQYAEVTQRETFFGTDKDGYSTSKTNLTLVNAGPLLHVQPGTEGNALSVLAVLGKMKEPKPLHPFECDKVTEDDGVDATPIHRELLKIKSEDDRRSAWNCYYYLWENWKIGDEEWNQSIINFFKDENLAFGGELNCAHSVLFAIETCRYFATLDREVAIDILKTLVGGGLLTSELVQQAKAGLEQFRYTIDHLAHVDLFPARMYAPFYMYGPCEAQLILPELENMKQTYGPNFVYDYLRLYWRNGEAWSTLVSEYLKSEEEAFIKAIGKGTDLPEKGVYSLHFLIAVADNLRPDSDTVTLELVLEIFEFVLGNIPLYPGEMTQTLTNYHPSEELFCLEVSEVSDASYFSPSPARSSAQKDLSFDPLVSPSLEEDLSAVSRILDMSGNDLTPNSQTSSPPKRRNALYVSPPSESKAGELFDQMDSYFRTSSLGSSIEHDKTELERQLDLCPSSTIPLSSPSRLGIQDLTVDVFAYSQQIGSPVNHGDTYEEMSLEDMQKLVSGSRQSPSPRLLFKSQTGENSPPVASMQSSPKSTEMDLLPSGEHQLVSPSKSLDTEQKTPQSRTIDSLESLSSPLVTPQNTAPQKSPTSPLSREVQRINDFLPKEGGSNASHAAAAGRTGGGKSPVVIETVEQGTMTPPWAAVSDFHDSLFLQGGEDVMTVVKVIFLWIGMIATLSLLYWGLYWQANAEDARRLDGRIIVAK